MAEIARQFAPVASPPPPKPPQLSIVASALMPDVATDTLGPAADTLLASAGWDAGKADKARQWHRPPGDVFYREAIERRNALIASVGVMSELEMQQEEQAPGLTPTSLPASIFPATSAEPRWTGGFAYAPENQQAAVLADPCGQTIDLPAVAPPVVAAAPSNAGGTLTHAASPYDYVVTAVNANGESLPSTAVTPTIAAGTTGSVVLTWPAISTASSYRVYGRASGSVGLLATVTNPTYTDTGAASPGAAPPGADTTAGPGNYTNLPLVKHVPFLIQVEDECSTWGWEERDFVGRALRLLDNATPNAIERELWLGAFAQNTLTGPMAGSNAFFTQSATAANGGSGVAAVDLSPGVTTGTGASVARGIQILEDYLANTGFGGQGMLHVAPETSPNLLGARRVGSLLLSVMDNIIVPGSGYPTSGATGPIGNAHATAPAGMAWMYATDLVSVRLDDPFFTPRTMAEATDRGSFGAPNTVRIRAQRFAAATWDQARLAACLVVLAT